MPMFVHLAPAKHAAAIRRAGLKPGRPPTGHPTSLPWGVFAVPVTANFVATHQWLRELRKCHGQRTLCAVYVRLPDEELVWFGHYGDAPRPMTAAQAAQAMMELDSGLGYQVIVPRPIGRREIHAVRALPQVLGWRHFPAAHGRRPCPCPVCLARGEYGSQQLRRSLGGD